MKQLLPNRRQAALYLGAAVLPLSALEAGSLVTASGSTAASATHAANAPGPGDSARWLPWPPERSLPALRLPDLQEQPWALAQEAGRVVLLNFWATWCEPCRAEMASFEVLQERFKAQRLKVVALNYKESRAAVQRFRDANAPALAYVRDSYGEATRDCGVHTFPTTFVINPAGRPLLRVEGEVDWASSAVHQRLQVLLEG